MKDYFPHQQQGASHHVGQERHKHGHTGTLTREDREEEDVEGVGGEKIGGEEKHIESMEQGGRTHFERGWRGE